MQKNYLIAVLICASTTFLPVKLFAQNLGVNTTTPNYPKSLLTQDALNELVKKQQVKYF